MTWEKKGVKGNWCIQIPNKANMKIWAGTIVLKSATHPEALVGTVVPWFSKVIHFGRMFKFWNVGKQLRARPQDLHNQGQSSQSAHEPSLLFGPMA